MLSTNSKVGIAASHLRDIDWNLQKSTLVLKLPLGFLFLAGYWKTKDSERTLTFLLSCLRDSDGKTCFRKEPRHNCLSIGQGGPGLLTRSLASHCFWVAEQKIHLPCVFCFSSITFNHSFSLLKSKTLFSPFLLSPK
uniref:Uncharacterized protein n=1 Tax=Myotis myotis TaxID=51298 RepID=A0A7J7WHS4_MYOMY|nr:hypothetical protein mMyoMyo1_012167 [Myotis myotis]